MARATLREHQNLNDKLRRENVNFTVISKHTVHTAYLQKHLC